MKTYDKAIVKEHEGLELTAYPDPASPKAVAKRKGLPHEGLSGAPWTIGYGHTGADVYEGLTITLAQAETLLERDLRTSEGYVNSLVKVGLTQNQFDALVSFVYNVGGGAFKDSTLLRLLNAGDYTGAADQLLRWNKAQGKVMAGLIKRRQKERELFLRG